MEGITRVILLIMIGFVVLGSILPVLKSTHWSIRMFDFPRFQLFVIGLFLGATFPIFIGIATMIDLLAMVLLSGSVVYQGWRILPYTRIFPREVKDCTVHDPHSIVRLLLANVQMENRSADRLLKLVATHRPDIVLGVEIDEWWTKQLSTLEELYPAKIKLPLDNTYGMLFYSSLELVQQDIRFLIEPDVPSLRCAIRLRSGVECILHCLHPKPPAPGESETSKERNAELLIVGREVKAEQMPSIVIGDLNDVAWSHTTRLFRSISGMLDPRIGRGMYNTFHAKWPLMRWPLDHIFHTPQFTFGAMKRLPSIGSDHFPVMATLCYQPMEAPEQPPPRPSAEDQKEASSKIEDGRKSGQ